jgi:hypothetical protein
MERHPDGHIGGTCVGCGHKPIWYVEGHPPLCVRGELVEKDTRPLTGGVTPEMVEAGKAALHRFLHPDRLGGDDDEIVEAIYLAMSGGGDA